MQCFQFLFQIKSFPRNLEYTHTLTMLIFLRILLSFLNVFSPLVSISMHVYIVLSLCLFGLVSWKYILCAFYFVGKVEKLKMYHTIHSIQLPRFLFLLLFSSFPSFIFHFYASSNSIQPWPKHTFHEVILLSHILHTYIIVWHDMRRTHRSSGLFTYHTSFLR